LRRSRPSEIYLDSSKIPTNKQTNQPTNHSFFFNTAQDFSQPNSPKGEEEEEEEEENFTTTTRTSLFTRPKQKLQKHN
jgi:hypothetical protein